MDHDFNLGDCNSSPGDGGSVSSDESTTAGSITASKNNHSVTVEVSSPFPVVDDENLELGGGNSSAYVSHSSVVGWPPIRRGHRLANQIKQPEQQSSSAPEPNKTLNPEICSDESQAGNGYRPVKVKMDGMLVGRKVDLCVHNSYETLTQALEDMFFEKEGAGSLNLLDAKSEFVLTFEDKDGDRMLLGDVPWRMFLSSVKRLRIVRNSEANKLGDHKRSIESPTCPEKRRR